MIELNGVSEERVVGMVVLEGKVVSAAMTAVSTNI